MPMRRLIYVLACIAALAATPSQAGSMPDPTGRIVLTVTGNISMTNAPGEARFDVAMLEALGKAGLSTVTPWTEGSTNFEGIWARDLLDAVGATGDKAIAAALNDYQVEIPLADFSTKEVLLALKMNGEYMRVRDKGPVWIIYPASPDGELQDMDSRSKMVWQLERIEVR